MKDRNVWQAHIEQAAYEAEVGDFSKMNILLNEIMELQEAAQHSAHPTLLPARHKLVSCPQCKLMFGVDLPTSQSG